MHFDLYLYLHGLYERKIKGKNMSKRDEKMIILQVNNKLTQLYQDNKNTISL